MTHHTPKTFAEATGLPIAKVRRGCRLYLDRTKDYEGWGLPAPKRHEVPCLLLGSPNGRKLVIPGWVAERMMGEA